MLGDTPGVIRAPVVDLKLTKTDIETRSAREALQFAIERADLMRTELFPMYGDLLQTFAAAKVPMFVTKGAEVSFTETEEKAKIEKARVWISSLPREMQNKVLALANALEIWAMPFTNGLADPEKAFELRPHHSNKDSPLGESFA